MIPGVRTALITGAIDAGRIGAIVNEAASVSPRSGRLSSMEHSEIRCAG